MTRATRTTKQSDGTTLQRPTVRLVLALDGEFVAEMTDRTLALRPKGTRRGGPSEKVIMWGSIYLRAVEAEIEAKRKEKARRRKRGRR